MAILRNLSESPQAEILQKNTSLVLRKLKSEPRQAFLLKNLSTFFCPDIPLPYTESNVVGCYVFIKQKNYHKLLGTERANITGYILAFF